MAQPEVPDATRYANRLLEDLGAARRLDARPQAHPALRWSQCGGLALTGDPETAPQMLPIPLASIADGIIAALDMLQPGSPLGRLDGARLLTERAALAGYRRGGPVSAGGSCRLLPAADAWLALNLPRASDWQLLPAWLEAGPLSDWTAVAAALAARAVTPCVERGRLLGLAVAPLEPAPRPAGRWCEELQRGPGAPGAPAAAPLVVDLSSLWAGPLCTHLLQLLGARVIKVESSRRPDGMREDRTGFYDLLNAGKASVALDFGLAAGRQALRDLLLRADIVVEASRPRALRQLGIRAEDMLAQNPRLTWVAISGYGREEPGANWVAFGDDGAVAGGLSQVLWRCTGQAMFCADAIADPLTGLHAALAAWCTHAQGGGRLLSFALSQVVAHCIGFAAAADPADYRARAAEWSRCVGGAEIGAPRAREPLGQAHALGADTAQVLAALRP